MAIWDIQKVALYGSVGGYLNSLCPLLLLLVLLGEPVEHVGEGLLLLGALRPDQLRARGHPLLRRQVLRVQLHALEGAGAFTYDICSGGMMGRRRDDPLKAINSADLPGYSDTLGTEEKRDCKQMVLSQDILDFWDLH